MGIIRNSLRVAKIFFYNLGTKQQTFQLKIVFVFKICKFKNTCNIKFCSFWEKCEIIGLAKIFYIILFKKKVWKTTLFFVLSRQRGSIFFPTAFLFVIFG